MLHLKYVIIFNWLKEKCVHSRIFRGSPKLKDSKHWKSWNCLPRSVKYCPLPIKFDRGSCSCNEKRITDKSWKYGLVTGYIICSGFSVGNTHNFWVANIETTLKEEIQTVWKKIDMHDMSAFGILAYWKKRWHKMQLVEGWFKTSRRTHSSHVSKWWNFLLPGFVDIELLKCSKLRNPSPRKKINLALNVKARSGSFWSANWWVSVLQNCHWLALCNAQDALCR